MSRFNPEEMTVEQLKKWRHDMENLGDVMSLLNEFCFGCPYGYCPKYEQEDEICPIRRAYEIIEKITYKEA